LKKNSAILFYSGTLISSIGSMTFTICLLAFMLKLGHELFYVSLILGLSRLIPVAFSTLWGQFTDKLPPRSTVIATELLAAAMSLGILLSWNYGKEAYWFLLVFCVLKGSIVTFQGGSRAKIAKYFSDDSYASNSKNAIWYNKVTQGATLFAGLSAWIIIENFSFKVAILVDMLSFVLNGFLILLITVKDKKEKTSNEREPFYKKFLDFYRFNPRVAKLDFLLCFSMMGTVSFMARLAGQDQRWNALFMAGYGFAVWFAGIIERGQYLKNFSNLIWIVLGISFIVLGFIPGREWLTLSVSIIKDTCFWLLFHRISTYVQMDTPQKVMGGVSSARMIQVAAVLAIGEIAVGAWQKVIPVFYDGLWRGVFCFILVAAMMLPQFHYEVKDGHAKI
jgi:MFS family permease